MYRIRPLLIVFFLVAFKNTILNAQLKLIESSEKKQPAWVQVPEPGNVQSTGTGNTIEEAKTNAIDSAGKIIKGKAVNIIRMENIYFQSLALDENAASEIFEGSAYFTDIKAGNCAGMYWEILQDKKTKKESCNYYIKYSLSPEKLSGVVQEIADERIAKKLDTLNEQLVRFKTTDQLKEVWKELMFLNPIIPDEHKNKDKSEELMQQVESIFNKIEIVEMIHIPGKIAVTQILNDRALETSVPPTFKSNCSKMVNAERLYEKWTIDYSYDKCPSSSPLSITLEFDNGFNKLSKDFKINTSEEKIEVKMSNTDVIIRGDIITFYVSSLYRKKLILERVIFRYNDINFTDTPMHQILDGAGLYDISFNLPYGFDQVKLENRVRGELYFKSAETGQKGVYNFYNCRIKRN